MAEGYGPDYHRIWNDGVDPNGFTDADPIAHSPEALMILMRDGQAAYREHLERTYLAWWERTFHHDRDDGQDAGRDDHD